MFIMEHTVHLSDTDATGQVYYARPLEWLEWCRVDWFNKSFGDFMAEVQKMGITFFPTRVEVNSSTANGRSALFHRPLTVR